MGEKEEKEDKKENWGQGVVKLGEVASDLWQRFEEETWKHRRLLVKGAVFPRVAFPEE